MTFEEAYARTKRVLNITVSTSGHEGIPSLLNYLTAPNVVSHGILCYWSNTHRFIAYLVRSSSLQCIVYNALLPGDPEMQG